MRELEAFHTGHAGSDILSIVLYILQGPLLVYLLHAYRSSSEVHGVNAAGYRAVLQELLLLAAPLLLGLTILSAYLREVFVLLLSMSLLHYFVEKRRAEGGGKVGKAATEPGTEVLSHFKGVNTLVTCMAILAVDFHIFPRGFAKTEEYGTALMDVGTGLFVASSALSSHFARAAPAPAPARSGLQRTAAVFLLGVGRLCAVRLLGYHEHVSEYGVHWNFFLSLGCVWVLAGTVHGLARTPARSALAGLLLAGVHQWALLQKGSIAFMFAAPREGFVAANREGLASVSGYLSVYLVGEGLTCWASHCLPAQRTQRLAAASVACWLVWGGCSTCLQETSRRLSNAASGALTLAVAHLLLLGFHLACVAAPPAPQGPAPVRLLVAMREHSLWVFLAANVMTGAVNSSLHTLQQGPAAALAILGGYVCVLSALACSLKK